MNGNRGSRWLPSSLSEVFGGACAMIAGQLFAYTVLDLPPGDKRATLTCVVVFAAFNYAAYRIADRIILRDEEVQS